MILKENWKANGIKGENNKDRIYEIMKDRDDIYFYEPLIIKKINSEDKKHMLLNEYPNIKKIINYHPDNNLFNNLKNINNLIEKAGSKYYKIDTIIINENYTIDKGIIINGCWNENWYHWLIEIASKTITVKHLPIEFRNYPLLVSKEVSEKKNFRSILEKILPEQRLIPLDTNFAYHVNECILLDSPVMAPPAMKNEGPALMGDYIVFKNFLIEYRDTLINSINEETKKIFPKKIFLHRKNNRRQYNQKEIYEQFEKIGFKGMYIEDYSIDEQILIFNSADEIVGPVGAAWANVIFARENTKWMYWDASFVKSNLTYSNLAGNLKIDLLVAHFDVERELFYSIDGIHQINPDYLIGSYKKHFNLN
jgi:hypothetical protein